MLRKDDLINAVLKGILNANDFYEKISNGLFISDSGVEGVLQTKIAESIFDLLEKDDDKFLKEESLALEFPFKKLFEDSQAGKLRGRIPRLVNGAKRVDIVVFDRDDRPLVPIEIKRNASSKGFAVDASRILGVLMRSDTKAGGSVKFGLICGFIFGEGLSKAECLDDLDFKKARCLEFLKRNIDIRKSDFSYRPDKPKEFDGSEWWVGGAICVYLRRDS